jgi:hypothetical protein
MEQNSPQNLVVESSDDHPPIRKASCVCGQLSLAVDGDPVRIAICHCHACQQRTGSVFGMFPHYCDYP